MHLIDIGANLGHKSLANDLSAVLARAREAEVLQIVVTGASVPESEVAFNIAHAHPGMLFSTAGVHPHLARDWEQPSGDQLRALAVHSEVVAIGETGLDFNRDFSPRPQQELAFEAQLALAAELNMPVFMHERDAHVRFVQILRAYRDRLPRAVIHCFTGSETELRNYLDLDLHVGVTGWICDERRGEHLRNLVSSIPANRLMLETDAPYLLPRDLSPKPKSRRNEPGYLPHILATVARCRDEHPEDLAASSTATARAFFDLPGPV